MKNKPTKHKELNRFKFQSFSERLNNVDVNVHHKIGHEYETQTEEQESYFHQALQKWDALNLTDCYDSFKKDVNAQRLITLPQILHSKNHIIEVLLRHLRLKNELSLQPLLELVVALCKDLQKEFYEYFDDIFDTCIDLLNVKSPDVIEWTFVCLAYIFKYLWRPLVKDIDKVFKKLVSLLDESVPDYIHNFASESFAFVSRKVRDREKFLDIIIKSSEKECDAIKGYGRLLFETVNGVSGQFHSCHNEILPVLFRSLERRRKQAATVFSILEEFLANLVRKIHPQNCAVVWQNLLVALRTNCDNYFKEISTENEDVLRFTLLLIGELLEYHNGRFLCDPTTAVQGLMGLPIEKLPYSIQEVVVKISALLLCSKHVKLSQEQASLVVKTIINLNTKEPLLQFVEAVYKSAVFESLILHKFLRFCALNSMPNDCLAVLSKIIVYKTQNGEKYLLDFKMENQLMQQLGTTAINIEQIEDFYSETYFGWIICIPYFTQPNVEELTKLYKKNLLRMCSLVKTPEGNLEKMLFGIYLTLKGLVLISGNNFSSDIANEIMDTVLPFANDDRHLSALQIVELYISAIKSSDQSKLSLEWFEKINQHLQQNFCSPFHEFRLLTSKIFLHFEEMLNSTSKREAEELKLFSIIHNILSTEPNLELYREQIRNLELLKHGRTQISLCKDTTYSLLPLRFLCGALYINFRLLWDPIVEVISTFAQGMQSNEFWSVFGSELRNSIKNKDSSETRNEELNCKFEAVNELYEEICCVKVKADFENYRLLLWKALGLFPEIAEAKTKDTSELFLQFVGEEFMKNTNANSGYCNIKQKSEETEDESKHQKTPKKSGSKQVTLLIRHLQVFSKIRSPKSMYREPELHNLYLDLLTHKNPDIQKLALDCLMTYKHKYLTPYKDLLYNLVDEKNFKNELALLRIDSGNDLIQTEHRPDLIPIVMRIVYGTMTKKVGLRTGGSSGGEKRRNLILRFLAGCSEQDLLIFTQMAFRNYREESEVDLERIVIPKKLLSASNLLYLFLENFSGLTSMDLHRFLLKVLLALGRILKTVFENIEMVHSGYLNTLKNLRTSCMKCLHLFFQRLDYYDWQQSEIDEVFSVFITAVVSKLHFEGIHSPTLLLKIISVWASSTKYFPLLTKSLDGTNDNNVIFHVVKLFLNEKCHDLVNNFIMDIFEKLLTQNATNEQLKITQNVPQTPKEHENLEIGSKILLPHVLDIIEFARKKLEKAGSLPKRDVFVLYKISEFVTDSMKCQKLFELLLPLTLKRANFHVDEEVLQHLLETLINLLKRVENKAEFLRKIAPFFACVNYVSCRKLLCKLLSLISTEYSDLMQQMNAYDTKWLDQPDFEKRLDAFKHIKSLCSSANINNDLCLLIMYNCYYMLSIEKDISLRDNAAACMKLVCPILIKTPLASERKSILDTTLNLIRKGIGSKDANTRNESIQLLGHLARECPETHVILQNLNLLTNKEDPEVDFFENITHLQLHRHGRALNKFSQVARNQTNAFNSRTLTQFVLPLVSYYVCAEKFAAKNAVVDPAVEGISVAARLLPWHQYEALLKIYLQKLRTKAEFQKQLVRIVIGILESFHFDLSNADVNSENVSKVEEIEEAQVSDDDVLLEDEVVEEGVVEEESAVKAFEKITVLGKSTANKVVKSIQTVLLPSLQKSLAELTQSELSHKVNQKKTRDEAEEMNLLKIPLSLAFVNLLQKLPKATLDAHLPGILMKLCTFLKSRLESVRRTARETLQKIMGVLGPGYLNILFDALLPQLTLGYQAHVLSYTTHSILSSLQKQYKPTDIDKILSRILKICLEDIFGALSEEKEVEKIQRKTSEAASTKSYHTIKLLSEYATEKCFLDIIVPLKEVLAKRPSFKTIRKGQECLRYVALGLAENKFVTADSLITFAFGAASEKLKEIACQKSEATAKQTVNDCFIIPETPKDRSILKSVKVAENTTAHVLVEFGLKLFYSVLKRDIVNAESFGLLDPFVDILVKSLDSQHVRLNTAALNCLSFLLKYDLPSLRDNIEGITEKAFGLLHKYAATGLGKGDNFDLVMAAFKVVGVIVRDVEYYTLNMDQLKLLLLYVEEDLHSTNRQATAFTLLKAIITRKLNAKELYETIDKVQELSITSELTHIRLQCRLIMHQFIMNYPLENKLNRYVSFYLTQLNYEVQFGRESALEMIQKLINSFPERLLKEHSAAFLITLGARLLNDDASSCRKAAADCIKSLFEKLPERDALFDIIIKWMNDQKVTHKTMAAHLCSLLVTVEKSSFEKRFQKLFPAIDAQFEYKNPNRPGQFVRLQQNQQQPDAMRNDRVKDHHMFQVFQTLLKICNHCPKFLKQHSRIKNIAREAQSLLSHPHDWVRVASAQFLGYVLSEFDTGKLREMLTSNEGDVDVFLGDDPRSDVKSLILDLLGQLQPNGVRSDMAQQVIKNLVSLSKALQYVDEAEEISLMWVVKKMRKIVNLEVVHGGTSTLLRTEIFKFIGALGTILEEDKLRSILHVLLAPLVREMVSTEVSNAPLRHLSKEVGKILKRRVGLDLYSKVLNKVQMQLNVARAERRKTKRQLAVTDPEVFAKKKIKLQEKKKLKRKRVTTDEAGHIKKKIRRKKVVEDDEEDIF